MDCPVNLAKLYREEVRDSSHAHGERVCLTCPVSRPQGSIMEAWNAIRPTLQQDLEVRYFSSNFYIYRCNVPLEGSLTLLEYFNSEFRRKLADGVSVARPRLSVTVVSRRPCPCAAPSCSHRTCDQPPYRPCFIWAGT